MRNSTTFLALIFAGIAIAIFLIEGGHDSTEPSKPARFDQISDSETLNSKAPEGPPRSVIAQPKDVNDHHEKPIEQENTQSEASNFAKESVYDVVFGRGSYGLGDVYETFQAENRDESWASAMESGISHSISQSDNASWATVERVECRATICVVLGFMPDPIGGSEPDLYSILGQNFGDGWWQGSVDVVTREHTFEGEGITRFALLIANTDRLVQLTSSPN